MQQSESRRCRAFTTIELLVVIGIIVALIGILIPVVGKVRESAKATDTAAWVQQLGGAIEAYHSDFRAYPGPLHNDKIRSPAASQDVLLTTVTGFAPATANGGNVDKITMSENLVLGLAGGLKPNTAGGAVAAYDPSLVGNGPLSLNPGSPKRFAPYVEPKHLSWQEISIGGNRVKTGAFFDDATIGGNSSDPVGADDSVIPEFVDRYSDPLPILYLRAKVGSNLDPRNNGKNTNPVITNDGPGPNGLPREGQYDISQIVGYTKTNPAIGVGRKLPVYYRDGGVDNAPQWVHGLTDVNGARVLGPVGGGYFYPFDAFPYFRDPSLSNQRVTPGTGYEPPHVARQKDRFVLISAGPDRIYGTNDDITNFGPVVP